MKNYSMGFLFVFLLSGCALLQGKDARYLWLEDIDSAKSLDWVEKESQATLSKISQEKDFKKTKANILKRLEDKDKLIYGRRVGKYFYNFWKDANHPRGLWRRTYYNSYISGKKPRWETLLDLSKLSEKENKKWVFKGTLRFSDYSDSVLVKLSEGGKDAVSVREFSLTKKDFVKGGWNLPEAKYSIAVVDEKTLLVGSNELGKTRSNYASTVRLLKKGETLQDAPVLMSIPENHMGLWAYNVESALNEKIILVTDSIEFFTRESYLYEKGNLVKIPVPKEAELLATADGNYFFQVKKNISFKGENLKSGAVYFLPKTKKGFSNLKEFFVPQDASKVLTSITPTKNYLVVGFQENVSDRYYRYSWDGEKWQQRSLSTKGEASLLDATFYDDRVLLQEADFLTPSSISVVDVNRFYKRKLQKLKSYFDESKYTYKQQWATSADGAQIPYYIVYAKNLKKNAANPTLMYGYGGFEISLKPFYLKNRGPEWLDKGGVFVLANIRGGGEFGPQWHQAAQKFNKKKSYEDFAAIAKKLFKDKITSPKHLGIAGGSNGGLLVGASTVLYPELYGAVFCAVPLLDMLRYDQLLAGASWIPEYGDPKIAKERKNLKTFSPFQNVKKDQVYPPVLFYTSTFDDRVHPAHARKMYHKMKDQGHSVYYYENSEGGHAGSADLKQRALMDALKYTFFKRELFRRL